MIDKIIFLDIDGVLNSEQWAVKFHKMRKNGTAPEGVNDLCDPEATDKLIKLLDETGAKIVLSSSWRSCTIEDTIKDFSSFRHTPFHKLVPYMIGVTPRLYNGGQWVCRGEEIQFWLDNAFERVVHKLILRGVEISPDVSYVIIDDDNDMLDNQPFVRTDWTVGLTDENIEQVIEIIEGKA